MELEHKIELEQKIDQLRVLVERWFKFRKIKRFSNLIETTKQQAVELLKEIQKEPIKICFEESFKEKLEVFKREVGDNFEVGGDN